MRRGVVILLALAALTPGGAVSETPATLVDFAAGVAGWRSVDDVVMGGISRSGLRATDDGTALFAGDLSLENNGGFASVRAVLPPTDLAGWTGLAVRVRGDGKRYQLRLRTDDRYDGIAYQASFATRPGEWTEVPLPFAAFAPTFRGRRPAGAPALDPARLRQVGLMIAEKQAGEFALELAWIRPYR